VPVSVVASIVGMSILLPLALGIAARWYRPNLADRLTRPVTVATVVLLIVGFVPLLVVTFMPMISLIGNGTILAIVAIAIIGLGVGHVLGGPDPKEQPVLALATATRHPAVAIAIASSMFPDAKLAPAAVVLTLIVTALATIPYQKWAKKSQVPPARLPLILPTAERRSVPRPSASASPGPSKMHAGPPEG
jgi:BASS family bile acid:Na+ symporter